MCLIQIIRMAHFNHSHEEVLPAIHTVSPFLKRKSALGFVMNSPSLATLIIMHWKSEREHSLRDLPVKYDSSSKVNDSTLKSSPELESRVCGTDELMISFSLSSCSDVPTASNLSKGYTLTSELGMMIFLSPRLILMMLAPLSERIGMLLRR